MCCSEYKIKSPHLIGWLNRALNLGLIGTHKNTDKVSDTNKIKIKWAT